MIEKQCAIEIKKHALMAVSELSQTLIISQGRCSQDEYEQLKMGVGSSIVRIQMDLLEIVYAAYPELNHLK
jgi:hypothetical protein